MKILFYAFIANIVIFFGSHSGQLLGGFAALAVSANPLSNQIPGVVPRRLIPYSNPLNSTFSVRFCIGILVQGFQVFLR